MKSIHFLKNYFLLKGTKINKNKTFEENNIKDNDKIVLQILDLKINLRNIIFTSINQKIQNYSMLCRNNENFATIEEDLYEEFPDFKETENFFLVKGSRINKNKTLEENNNKNNDIIVIQIFDLKINLINIFFFFQWEWNSKLSDAL